MRDELYMEQQKNELNTYTLDRIQQKIREIIDKSEGDDYIYRGEAQYHKKVCSGLYRDYIKDQEENQDTENEENYDVVGSQKVILEKIKRYLPERYSPEKEPSKKEEEENLVELHILAELQHYGAKTNLIDFTPDFLIALYFACEKEMGKNGRVILLKEPKDEKDVEKKGYRVIKPSEIIERIKPQKSLLVEAPAGFITPDDTVFIPRELKLPILTYIEKYHAISREYIYNDIHGFIKLGDIETHYLEFEKGKQKKNEQTEQENGEPDFSEAINHYEIVLKLEPNFPEAYSELGQIYFLKGNYDRSIESYDEAIELNPDDAEHYSSRAKVHAHKNEHETAVKDYNRAIEKNTNDPSYCAERCKSFMKLERWDDVRSDINILKDQFGAFESLKLLANFARDENIKLPEDIESMLSPVED